VPTYRIYIVGRDGGFLGAPEVVECVDDNEAIGAAVQITSGLGAEIWDQKRFVAQLPASDSGSLLLRRPRQAPVSDAIEHREASCQMIASPSMMADFD
jgi:hypothetical protein